MTLQPYSGPDRLTVLQFVATFRQITLQGNACGQLGWTRSVEIGA